MKKPSLRIKLTAINVGIIIAIAILFTYNSVQGVNTLAIKAINENEGAVTVSPQNMASHNPEPKEVVSAGKFEIDHGLAQSDPFYGEPIISTAKKINTDSLIYMLIIIIIGGVVTYLILGRALKPLVKLNNEINGIGENELSTRVEIPKSGDEVGDLALSFNAMLGRLERAFSAQKGFALAAAHELKTPLTAIKTTLDVFGSKKNISKGDQLNSIIPVVKKHTDRMITLVDDLFDLANLQQIDFSDDVNIENVLKDAVEDLEKVAIAGGISIMLNRNADAVIKGNASALRRAFINIIDNAIKYNIENGKINITLDKDEEYVLVVIEDSGIGIEEVHLQHLFEPLYRIDKSRSRDVGGAGLGLALTKEIIDQHHGEVVVSSVYGEGTKITVKLCVR